MPCKKKSNFYAVVDGRTVGIFDEWIKCGESVIGYKKCSYQGFQTIQQAEDYLKSCGISNILVYSSKGSMSVETYNRNKNGFVEDETKPLK